MPKYDYDLIAIGAGAGGFVSTKLAAGLGKKAALIEKDLLGGECTNRGCVPSKALIKAAAVAYHVKHLRDYGLDTAGSMDLSTRNVMQYVRGAVKKVFDSHPAAVFEKLGIDVLFGAPKFLDSHRVSMGDRVLSSDKFIIATGSSAFIPPIEGLASVPYLSNENLFDLETLPSSMIILGAGPIGMEMASALNRLGVTVTVVEMSPRTMIREDEELAGLLADHLASEGLSLLTGTKAVRAAQKDGGIVLTVEDARKDRRDLQAASILVAVGRRPNVEGLDLEKAGVAWTPKGITTDSYLRTTAPNIFACGDVAGPYQFSHMTEYQAVTAVRNAFLPFRKKVNYDTVAWCTFTAPEFAHAGLTEREARERHGDGISVYRYDYKNTDRGRTDLAEFGRAKFICDRRGRLLGAHILGERAGELIHEAQLLRHLNLSFTKIAPMIHIYPTFTDVVRQPAKLLYVDRLRNNPVLKLLAKVLGKKK
jgi:pyruvate/2-oxoglutarate dehydrogenase complex dihydrolipoamide dehydrogenase (E3) component